MMVQRGCYEVPWVCVALGRDAVFWSCSAGLYLFRGLGGGGEGDGVTELFELSDEEPSASFWLIAACEVIGAEFVECCFVVDEVPADHQDRVRDRDQRALLASPFRYPPETDTEVTV
jgi:hypothetical protein